MSTKSKRLEQRRRERQSRQREALLDSALAKCFASVDFSFGDVNNANLDIHDMRWKEEPNDLKEAFKQARRWNQNNEFIGQAVDLKTAFLLYGFQLVAFDRKDNEKLKAWLEKRDPVTKQLVNKLAVQRYVREAANEWHIQSNILTFWRDKQMPFLLLPENCRYTDAMGVEKLYVCLGYQRGELEGNTDVFSSDKDVATAEVKRYSTREILVKDPKGGALAESENFLICTKGLRGRGLGWPEMYRIFRTASQHESLQVGEAQYALLARLVVDQHKIGWEAKNTQSGHKQASYLYKAERAKAIMAQFGGAAGLLRIVSQFDHNINHVWCGKDKDAWDARKWDTTYTRMLWWAGPVGYMMMSKSVSPFLLPMLEKQMVNDRTNYIGPHLEAVLSAIAPVPVQVKFSNRCFQDQRLAWQMVKDLMQQGPLSLGTALTEGGFDKVEEADAKEVEADPKNDKKLLPKYDPNHAKSGNPMEKTKGRTNGSKNGEGIGESN